MNMKYLGIFILIPIVLALEIIAILFSLFMYLFLFAEECTFTQKIN